MDPLGRAGQRPRWIRAQPARCLADGSRALACRRLRGGRVGTGEGQLGLEDLLVDLGDVVYLVDPDVTAGTGGLEAVRVGPLHQVVVDGRVDTAGPAAADRGRRL